MKTLLVVLFCPSLLLAQSRESKPMLGSHPDGGDPLNASLAACWLLNEGSGSAIYDISGNGKVGSFVGSPSWVPGRDGSALSLDGASVVSLGALNFVPRVDAFTIAFWYYCAPGSATEYVLSKRGGSAASTNQYFFLTVNGVFSVGLGDAASSAVSHADVRGRWAHATLTVPAATTGAVFYLDGVARAYSSGSGDIGATTTALTAVVGARHDGTEGSYAVYSTGRISDLRCWSRVLSPSEVERLYTEGAWAGIARDYGAREIGLFAYPQGAPGRVGGWGWLGRWRRPWRPVTGD